MYKSLTCNTLPRAFICSLFARRVITIDVNCSFIYIQGNNLYVCDIYLVVVTAKHYS